MNEIKASLALLCKEIKVICNVDVKPENLRQAKFNQGEENNVQILWNVLNSLCVLLSLKETNRECDTRFVKCCFASWCYKRIAFYKVPTNGKDGSRELLIALAWLIAEKKAFDILITHKFRKFETEIKSNSIIKEIDKSDCKGNTKTLSYEDNLNYILFLCGKIKHNLKHINEYDEEYIKLNNKIHQATQVLSGVPHLSIDETKLFLQNEPNASVKKIITELQTNLHVHRKWKESSCVFWKWMDTVLEKADLEDNLCTSQENNEALIEFIKVLIANIKFKLKRASEDGQVEMANAGTLDHFPKFIFHPEANQSKSTELKCLNDVINAELEIVKTAVKKMENKLYQKLKDIAENELGPVVFAIPQMYSK